MIEKLLRYLRGYVKVQLVGPYAERFLNLVNARGIFIWNIVKNDTEIYFYIDVKELYELKPILRKTKMKIYIKERYGLPFFLFFHRKRKMFFAGLFFSWVIVYIMSQFVWSIGFEGNSRHTEDELMKFLETLNVDEGIKKEKIDSDVIEKALRNEYFDITWASVEIKGTKLIVHIRENSSIETENYVSDEMCGNVVSSTQAVVTSIITRTGTPMVKAGQQVEKGDVLIEGRYEIYGDDLAVIEERQVRADGDVIGQVTYNIDETIDKAYTKKEYTGNEYTLTECYANGMDFDMSLWFQKKKYKLYDTYSRYEQIVIGDSFYLPVIVEKKVVKEYILGESVYSDEEVTALAERKLMYILKKIEENTIQILENNVKIEVGEKNCRLYGQIIVLENIGSFGGTYE